MLNISKNYMNFILIDILFLPERIKIEKVWKLIANLLDKTEYVIHKRNLKQTLNHGCVLEKAHKYKYYKNTWLKSNVHVNIDLRKKANNDIEKHF